MSKISISADPYHQQFVPIDRCRRLARIAEEMLGPQRVQVRWRDWIGEGFDTSALEASALAELFASYARRGRERLNGRAADVLAGRLPLKPVSSLADESCGRQLLGSKHVHVDGAGRVMPGTCAGITLGVVGQSGVAEIWRALADDYAARPVVGALVEKGPVGLMNLAAGAGFVPQAGYAGKCHLCWDVRRHLSGVGAWRDELGPRRLYL